jgi:hypothetical protein
LFKKDNLHARLALNEANFNHLFNWTLMELAVDTVEKENLTFVPGEYTLDSSSEEYKADGVVFGHNGFELCLLETSGHYGLKDGPRFAYDHVKGAFGSLTMLNKVITKYYHATKETALKSRVPYIHSHGK